MQSTAAPKNHNPARAQPAYSEDAVAGPSRRTLLLQAVISTVAAVLPRRVVTALSGLKARVRLGRASRIAKPLVKSLFGPRAVPSTLAATGDVLVTRVQQAGHREPLILKLARSESAKLQLEHEAGALGDLGELVIDLTETLPVAEKLDSGSGPAGAWFTQSDLPGDPTAALTLQNDQIVSIAARTLAPFYRASQEQVACSAVVLQRLVGQPISTIGYWRPALQHQLDDLADWLGESLGNRELSLSRIHGDLGPTNLLWDLDNSTISGIVDWTYSTDHLLPEIDLVHLAISLVSDQQNAEYGDVVASLCSGEAEAASLCAVRKALDVTPNGLDVSGAAALSWLHHVSFGLQRQAQLRTNPLWLRHNVDAVAQALAAQNAHL